MGEFVTIARVVKTQGRIGEVAADLLTDFPERFSERKRLFVLAADGSRRELHLENFWQHKERVVLKFAGIDSIGDAEALIASEIQIPKKERAKLEGGAEYISDLIGCQVFDKAREVGEVADVTFGAGEAPILQVMQGKKEYLVPLAQEYIRRLDTAAKRIELDLPEGMLELDAPLTTEEKKSQKNARD